MSLGAGWVARAYSRLDLNSASRPHLL